MSGKIVLQRRSDCILKSASHITFCPISFKEAVSVQDTIQTYLLGGNACHFWQNHLRSEKDKPLTIYILHIQTTQGPNSVKSNIGSDHTTKAGKVFVFVAKKLYGRQGQPQLYIWNFWKTVTTYTLEIVTLAVFRESRSAHWTELSSPQWKTRLSPRVSWHSGIAYVRLPMWVDSH